MMIQLMKMTSSLTKLHTIGKAAKLVQLFQSLIKYLRMHGR